MKAYGKLSNLYRREVYTKPRRRISILTVALFINLIIFGIYGSYIGIKNIFNKRELLKTYEIQEKGILDNIDKLNEIEQFISTDTGIETLEKFIPSNDDLSVFLEDIAEISFRNNFILKRLDSRIASAEGDEQLITITLIGDIYSLPNFIKDLESFERFTLVRAISASKSRYLGLGLESTYNVVVSVSVFNTENIANE